MFTIYIAKATEDFGLPVMHQIYERFCQTVKQHKCAFDSLLSWDALWVDLVHSDDCYHLLIPPLFQSDLVCLLNSVGWILVPCTNRLYGPVLTLQMYHAPYASRIL